jgi:hypothetical protein
VHVVGDGGRAESLHSCTSATCCGRLRALGVMPLAQDTVQITSHAAPVCGGAGAQKVAFQRAAVETIRHGYDRFLILGGEAQTETRVLGYTPTTAYTTGAATATGYGYRWPANLCQRAQPRPDREDV